jgi:elongation factor G
MERFGLGNIRNFVLLGHSGSGKTSLVEAVLFNEKQVSRLGKVDDGTSASDHDADEIKRKISINLTVLSLQTSGQKINILDTPGYTDFVGEVKSSMRVCDGAVVTVCAASGIEVGTEQAWDSCEVAELPRIIFINKMDRENADFTKVSADLREKFGSKCVPLQIPVGSQSTFSGVVDILTQKAYLGTEMKESEIPAELKDEVATCLEQLTEAVAETDDGLLEKYLDGKEISPEEMSNALHAAVVEGKIVPVFTGSALQNIGIGALLNAVINYLPAPAGCDVVTIEDGGEKRAKPSGDAPLAALVFKTMADPYVGKLTCFRVYNGSVASNSQVWNQGREAPERIGQLFVLKGKSQEPIDELHAGDIGAVAKLSVTATGDTLCTKEKPVKIAAVTFPPPIYSQSVHPKGKADVDKMGPSLTRMVEEDPTLRVKRDAETGETVLSGMGDTQLMVAAERMQRKFGVGVDMAMPKVPYKETIQMPAKGEHKHKKQSGGHGQYGHVLLDLEPLERGHGAEFAERVVGGSVPKNYIPAVEKGVMEGFKEGSLAGFPVVDVKCTLYDGSFHPVDSSEICFKIAGSQAVRKGLAAGQPVIIEPVMNLEVTVPDEFTGDIIADLNTKRARVSGMNPGGGKNIIEAQVPQSEILRYAIDLKSITQGRGSFTMEFSHYENTPQIAAQKIIAEREAEKNQ